MARSVKRQVQTPREMAEARAILSRYYEAERAFPHLTQRQIAATLLPGRRDPARLIRQLRSGERLNVARREVQRAEKERAESPQPGAFVAAVEYVDENGVHRIRRIDLRVPGAPTRLDVFRIARRPQWRNAIEQALQVQRDGSKPLTPDEAVSAQLLTVKRPAHAMRGTVVVVQGLMT